MLRPLRFLPDDTSIVFMPIARKGFYVSMVLCVLSIGLFFVEGLNYGIDFRGGTLIEIKTQGPADLGDLRSRMSSLGLGDTELQEFGEPDDVLIRIATQPGGEEAQQAAVDKVKAALPPGVDYRRVEVVGPKVSGELARDGTIAVVVAICAVLIYIWFRFEWQFAFGAVASLAHDVILTIGLFAILQIGFDLSIIAAILTIVGYSLNDTVVVFDRFRENLRRYKQKPLDEIIDQSLNQTLPRTIMTSISTLVALIALYVFGGEVIRGFTFAMIWGVVVGTYSSIFIAAPVLIFLGARIGTAAGDAKAEAEKARP
jgi:preprotein translocase SecF subunit